MVDDQQPSFDGTPSSSNSTGSIPQSNRITGFGLGLGLGISIVLVLLFAFSALFPSFCSRRSGSSVQAANEADVEAAAGSSGVDEATLMSYPKVVYGSHDGAEQDGAAACCCSICLADYVPRDVLRRLPKCGHLFHLDCVDPWLRSHGSCPVCRSSPADVVAVRFHAQMNR